MKDEKMSSDYPTNQKIAELRTISPRRFNPDGNYRIPILGFPEEFVSS